MKTVRFSRILPCLALGIALSASLSGCAASDSAPLAKNGRIDLSSWDFSRGDVDLVGDWSVCWGQLIEPGEACPTDWRPVHVRGLWSDDSARSPFGGKGVATYRLEVVLPVDERSLSLSAGAPMTAYRLWIDGEPQPGSGVVGRTAETTSTVPRRNLVFSLPRTAEPVELHVQLANFEFRGGGIRRPWLVGRPESIAAYRGLGLLRDAMLFAVGGVVGLLYLTQFALRPQEVDRGYFGFFALVVAFRSIPASISDLSQLLFPWASFAGLMRLEYLGEALVMVAGAGYFPAKVRGVMPPRTMRGLQMFSLALGLFVAVAPFAWVVETLPFFLVLPPVILALVLYCYGSAWWRGVEGVRITLVASLVFSLGVIHDVIRTSVTDFGFDLELFPYLIVVWILAEAFGQAQIFARTFARAENLSDELSEANFELQETESAIARFVPFDLLGLLGKPTIRDVAPGDHVRVEMSVVHCDLGGFDEIASCASSEEAVRYLKAVVEALTPVIQHNGGFVTEHRGEGLQALFPGGVDDAVRASIAMLRAARESRVAFELGIGIETGPLLLGTAGEGEQLLGSVMGSAVIGAERLASLTRKSEARLLLSEATRAAWPDASDYSLDTFSANGVSRVWEVVEARQA